MLIRESKKLTEDTWILKAPLGSRVGSQSTQKGGASTVLMRPCLPIWSPCGPISSAFFHNHWLTPELWPVISKFCAIGHWGHQEIVSMWLAQWKLTSRYMAPSVTSVYKGNTATLQGTKYCLMACWSSSATRTFHSHSFYHSILPLLASLFVSPAKLWALRKQKLCLIQLRNPGTLHSVGT